MMEKNRDFFKATGHLNILRSVIINDGVVDRCVFYYSQNGGTVDDDHCTVTTNYHVFCIKFCTGKKLGSSIFWISKKNIWWGSFYI